MAPSMYIYIHIYIYGCVMSALEPKGTWSGSTLDPEVYCRNSFLHWDLNSKFVDRAYFKLFGAPGFSEDSRVSAVLRTSTALSAAKAMATTFWSTGRRTQL